MGCCISKCRPKKHYIEDLSHVQDKVVISSSQAPKTPVPVSNKISPLPLSPTISSSSSVSSFTCTTSSNTTSSCSSLPSSSSVLSSKDRSFSNEFLWACVKENPHIIRINSIKEASLALATTKSPLAKPTVAPVKQAIQAMEKGSTPRKRGRSSSPSTLTRQKSFRKEPDRLNSAYYLPSRSLRSPSPSRRFIGDTYSNRGILATTISKEICSSKRIVASKVNALNSVSSSLRKENFRPSSPTLSSHNPSTPLKSCLRNRETFIHRISSKLDESALRAALAQQENDSIFMEDIDNPLISLDCFIFL
ncbi:uncharacterized serine-rich protein C215.13-like [Durio zibethinus]|uniref:Uncharacterized serine-rich protein C215.13-like n=1 Tax=Durio zibethinus TaxID=66656 RepID=A0A6P6B612_DURZI|nr:uncharacterized serine-rich protein C215.13-like [Durio zibethinus]